MLDKDKAIYALLDYQSLVKKQERRIVDMASLLYTGQEEKALDELNDFTIENEAIYLKLKKLSYDLQGEQSGNRHEMIGTTDLFPSSLTEVSPGLWKFHLPPFFSVNSSERGPSNAGKHIFYLVMNLEEEYEKSNRKLKVIEKPIVIFEHHICSDFQKVFDFDNIDSKRALDALQGSFINDDNALSLMTVNLAVKDPKESYCDIYIADRNHPKVYEILAKSSRK